MKFKTVAAIVAGMFISAVVHAVPIVNTNVRPVVLGATPAGEQSLQTVLNSVFGTGAVSAANNRARQACGALRRVRPPPFLR